MLIGSFFIDTQALYEFIVMLIQGVLLVASLGVALLITLPLAERVLLVLERWCGRG